MQQMKELNLIWQTSEGDQTTFELEYTTEILFSKFQQNKFFDNKSYKTVLDNSVIIYSNNSNTAEGAFLEYINKFVENNYKFYLLHFSNEDLNHNCEYYSKAQYVFRNYYDENITAKNVTFIPLGFKTGYYNKERINDCDPTKYNGVFIGQPKRDRNEVIDILTKETNNFIHLTNSWNCPTSLNQQEVIEIYKQTKFAPCPMGWQHVDSFRIMEALEWGCIPILKKYQNKNTYIETFGKNPIPIVENWSELSSILESQNYCELKYEVMTWYNLFKEELSNKIYQKITKDL
jgi:hypothetical protein